MSWRSDIDEARNAVEITYSGALTEEELMDGVRALIANPHFSRTARCLHECSALERFLVPATTLEMLAQWEVFTADSRQAFIVSNGLIAAFVDLYVQFGAKGKIETFANRADALAFLNADVTPDQFLE